MVPGFLLEMEAFPLTRNGKVDKRQLPEPEMAEGVADWAPPRTLLEAKLLSIWQAVVV